MIDCCWWIYVVRVRDAFIHATAESQYQLCKNQPQELLDHCRLYTPTPPQHS